MILSDDQSPKSIVMTLYTRDLAAPIAAANAALLASVFLLFCALTGEALWRDAHFTAAGLAAAAAGVLGALRRKVLHAASPRPARADEMAGQLVRLIGLVGGCAVGLGLLPLIASIPWAGAVVMTAIMLLLIVTIIMINDLPRQFCVAAGCAVPVTEGRMIVVLLIIAISVFGLGVAEAAGRW